MPSAKKILITGATGYIGRRLKARLLNRDDLVCRLLVRNRNKVSVKVRDLLDIVEGDTFQQEALDRALAGIDAAYYLIHSMGKDKDFKDLDRKSAENFRDAAIRAGVRRIIYLGGLGVRQSASKHLLSRIETGEILSAKPAEIQTIWFRAGVIIGSGSASFDIIRNLVQKLPCMITPKWVTTLTQPISIEDVLSYLVAAINLPAENNLMIDIGAETMNFKQMMLTAAKVMGLKRWMIPVPFLSPRLSSYWLIFFTPVPYALAAALVEGLKSETISQNDHAAKFFPDITPEPYAQAVARALKELEQQHVISRWCDSSAGVACDIKEHEDPGSSILRDVRTLPLEGTTAASVYQAACGIGGEHGWYTYTFLWRLRGFIDKMAGGYGLSRGRRVAEKLRVGDALDFWKVADLKENKRILLLAQMKVPGKAWLEFDIQQDQLVQTAHFLPSGIWGRIYWYIVAPLHNLVFVDLVQKILATAKGLDAAKISS
ncbi:MAG: SDR family oxidoreductase [Desulfobulbaceae bacterium]|nr:SDR family oxidoreductase [Desulfobulbaceae bacterium]